MSREAENTGTAHDQLTIEQAPRRAADADAASERAIERAWPPRRRRDRT